ncbi:MAG: thymidylate synthase [Candidatus Latescibacteria bacterium]|jgi:thymidylate synthase|nr:thymidylate synthase [Candidatus Latescibacterota bacterium]
MPNDATQQGRLPTLHVEADSIPQAHFRAIKAVWENGLEIRTEYDRRNADGSYLDPPSRDARVLIEVKDPFAQPRYPATSFCEIGTYIAEIMGAKDHMVVPMAQLKDAIEGELGATEWPYTYHQRLFDHPDVNGETVNQIEMAIDRVAQTPYTRRGVATTNVPNVDPFLTEDVPCLREVQLRCPEDADGNLVLNMNTSWRSRDLFKAWADNVIGITYMHSALARDIETKAGRPVKVGSYADYSMSLHIYGQDFTLVGGDESQGIKSFFDNFDEEAYIARSFTSEDAAEMLVLPQLKGLLTEEQIAQWGFTEASIDIIEGLISDIEEGRTLA